MLKHGTRSTNWNQLVRNWIRFYQQEWVCTQKSALACVLLCLLNKGQLGKYNVFQIRWEKATCNKRFSTPN